MQQENFLLHLQLLTWQYLWEWRRRSVSQRVVRVCEACKYPGWESVRRRSRSVVRASREL